MLNPTYLEQLPEPVIDLVSELEKEIIADLTKRIVKGNYNTPSAEWMTYKANQLRLSSAAINKIIAQNAKVREKTVRELYTEAVRLALSEDAEVYRYAIKDNIISKSNGAKLNTYFRSIPLNDAFRKGLQNTNGLMHNLTNSMAATANKMLSDAMDLAWLETVSGAFTPDEAVFKAVTDLTGKGLKVVKYDSGRTDQVDVAVRRAVRTSVNKTAGDMQLDLASEMGCDLVEVTSHLGARPSHAEWQGQVYSISGKNPKYKPFSVTGYGTGDGLCGWNCRHSFYPYFEGLSERASIPKFTAEENAEYYKLTQQQRAYERAIRQSKRELAALDSARQNTDDPALKAKLDKQFERKSATLKNREQRLDSFCKNNGLQKDNSRVRTVGFDRSVSQKAVHAAKNYNAQKSAGASGNGSSGGVVNERYTKSDYENISKTKVDTNIFNNERWRNNFERITDNSKVNNSLRNLSEQMLKHRGGTFYEDMYFIDAKTGKIMGYNTTSQTKCAVGENESLRKALENHDVELIGIHNHPYSGVPSLTDLNLLVGRDNQSKGVIICHDGTIFVYTKPQHEISEQIYNVALTKYKIYSKMSMEDKGFEILCEMFGFTYERIEL